MFSGEADGKVFTELRREGLITIFADLVQTLYRKAFSAETKCNIMFALTGRVSLEIRADVELVRSRRAFASVFGLNVIGVRQFSACFDRWLAGRSSRLVILQR